MEEASAVEWNHSLNDLCYRLKKKRTMNHTVFTDDEKDNFFSIKKGFKTCAA